MDIIEETLRGTKDYEPPIRFYYWSMLAATSAILKDKVWFQMEHYRLHPNIYVLLYGPSGIRKGPPIAWAEDLVTGVDNTRVIDGRSSIEAVIHELGEFRTREGRPPIKDSCGFMVASELSSSIVGNSDAMNIMTNLYDRQYNQKTWNYRLKISASAKLVNPTITWLAGTNEALFRDFMPEKNLHGGLIGRMFIISETKKNRTNSLLFRGKEPPNKAGIIERMLTLAKMQGEFSMNEECREALDQWYIKFDNETGPGYKDDTGFVSRVLDFIIKIGMIVAIARRGELILTIDDIVESTKTVLPLIMPTMSVVNRVKKDDSTVIKKRSAVLLYLTNCPEYKCERSRLLQNLSLQIDHEDLDKIAQMMIQMSILTIDMHGGTIVYRLRVDRPEVAEWLKRYKN